MLRIGQNESDTTEVHAMHVMRSGERKFYHIRHLFPVIILHVITDNHHGGIETKDHSSLVSIVLLLNPSNDPAVQWLSAQLYGTTIHSYTEHNHRLDKSRSQRIVWLLEECKGIDYDVKIYKRNPQLAPPELKKVHPLGKSPVITIETPATTEPLVLAETGALTEYLTDYFAQHLVPTRYKPGKENQVGGESEEWLRYRYFMHYAEGSLMTLLLVGLFIDRK